MKATGRKRPIKAGASPIPCGPGSSCGHEGGACGPSGCQVRYVGPVSHLRDHFAMHAARGATHVWAAAVITGLSLVVTGALAFTVVEAKQSDRDAALARKNATRADIERIMNKLDEIEQVSKETRAILMRQFPAPTSQEVMDGTMPDAGADTSTQ